MDSYADLPDSVKDLLHSQFVGYLRRQFEEIEQEIRGSFWELPETQKQYAEYADWVWQQTLRENDNEWEFIEFLKNEFGITAV